MTVDETRKQYDQVVYDKLMNEIKKRINEGEYDFIWTHLSLTRTLKQRLRDEGYYVNDWSTSGKHMPGIQISWK